MISSYFSFRIKQIARFLNSIGFVYILIVLVLLSGVLFQGLSNIITLNDGPILIVYACLLLGIFAQRKDAVFLSSTDQNLIIVYFIDALILGLPLSILFALFGRWQITGGIILLSGCIALLWASFFTAKIFSSSNFSKSKFDVPFLTLRDFELKYLFRKNLLVFSLVYVLCLCLAWHPASIFVMSFIFIMLFQSVFEFYEPKELIFSSKPASMFLVEKAIRLSGWVLFIQFPFYLIGLFFSFSFWYLYVLVFVSTMVMVFFTVFNKYVFYRPNVHRSPANVLASIMLIFMLMPGFQIVVLLMSVIQFFKAKNNLEYYRL